MSVLSENQSEDQRHSNIFLIIIKYITILWEMRQQPAIAKGIMIGQRNQS